MNAIESHVGRHLRRMVATNLQLLKNKISVNVVVQSLSPV